MATPQWLQDYITNMQKTQDAKDADNLRIYAAAAASWIENNVRNRDAGTPLTAPPALPTVTTFYDAGNYVVESHTVPNPAALPPVLPPPTKTQPAVPFVTGGAARDEMMFSMLMAIARDVAQMKAKMGA